MFKQLFLISERVNDIKQKPLKKESSNFRTDVWCLLYLPVMKVFAFEWGEDLHEDSRRFTVFMSFRNRDSPVNTDDSYRHTVGRSWAFCTPKHLFDEGVSFLWQW